MKPFVLECSGFWVPSQAALLEVVSKKWHFPAFLRICRAVIVSKSPAFEIIWNFAGNILLAGWNNSNILTEIGLQNDRWWAWLACRSHSASSSLKSYWYFDFFKLVDDKCVGKHIINNPIKQCISCSLYISTRIYKCLPKYWLPRKLIWQFVSMVYQQQCPSLSTWMNTPYPAGQSSFGRFTLPIVGFFVQIWWSRALMITFDIAGLHTSAALFGVTFAMLSSGLPFAGHIRLRWTSWMSSRAIAERTHLPLFYAIQPQFVLHRYSRWPLQWFEPEPVSAEPVGHFRFANLFQPFRHIWLRYFVVVNVYKIGLTAELSGSTKTTRKA